MTTHEPNPLAWKRLGEHLREARVRLGIPREFTSLWLRVDRMTIARIEEGKARPSVVTLAAMETALGLPPGSTLAALAGQPAAMSHPSTLIDPTQQPTLCRHDPNC
ncbi:helix-turn-helix domain-containing protein [Streptomyces sp. ME01-18h]|uniref:helix-turn-helix domain-containing protein n=1 Tax=Streptomyces sp. ME01-18h TaxID=462920 RepID=UPI0039F670FE